MTQESHFSGVGGKPNVFSGQTSTVGSQNTSHLNGKIVNLEDTIRSIAEELNYHKNEVSTLRSEKDTLEQVLTIKTQEVRKTLTNENFKVEEELKRCYAHQKVENSRLQQQVTALRGEKTALDMQLIELERRIAEVEMQVGTEEN